MNPLRWKREHQVAWVLTMLLAALVGLILVLSRFADNGLWGLFHMAAIEPTEEGALQRTVDFAREMIADGVGFGALFAGMIFYIVKLVQT